MFDLSQQKFDFDCPKCGRKNTTSLAQVANQSTITCRYCSQRINLQDNNGSARKTITDVNRSFKSLEDTLKRFGK